MHISNCVEGSSGPSAAPLALFRRSAFSTIHTCRISGLAVRSEIELPGAVPSVFPSGSEDVEIRLGKAPERLDRVTARGRVWELNEREFLLNLAGVARYWVRDGRSIDMEAAAGVDAADGLAFLLGTCFGALLLQRGGLVLHGSSVALDGRAWIFCGRSGIGKSSLAAALCGSGCRFVNDDVCSVGVDDCGQPVLWPDGRRLKLFESSIDHLALGGRERGVVRTGIAKHFVDPPGAGVEGPVRLAGIYILRDQSPGEQTGVERLNLVEAAQALLQQNFRPSLARAMAKGSRQVAITAAVLRHAPVFTLTRPRDLAKLSKTVAELRNEWAQV